MKTVIAVLGVLSLSACSPPQRKAARLLRVCADPNNLPFSNERGEGLENKLAALVAREIHAELRYTWWAQRRGYLRNTLKAKECDVLMSAPTGMGPVLTTAPYYRSSYVFVTRQASGEPVSSFDDPRLRELRIGVQLVGDDGANTPPAHALGQRGIVRNTVGFHLQGDYRQANPPARLIEAVARGDIDVAVAWGPLAGYFAGRQQVPLTVTPVSPRVDRAYLPMVYDISLAVRHGEEEFRQELQQVLDRNRIEIVGLLDRFGVPRVP